MICVVSYLDDFAFFATTKTGMRQAIQEFKALLKRLNLSINMSKSDFTPKRSIEYLGVQFDQRTFCYHSRKARYFPFSQRANTL